MRTSFLIVALFLAAASVDPKLTYLAGSKQVVDYWMWLEKLRATHPDRDDRLIAWAQGHLRTPYVLDCQGEGEGKDPDPLFTPNKVDCTVFVLQAAASLDATSALDLLHRMILANYRRADPNGRVHYKDRYHYSEDRILSSPLFRDITTSVFPADHLKSIHMELNRKSDGKLAMPIHWSRPVDMHYCPGATLADADLARFPRVCGVMFVRKANFPLGLIVGHEGIVVNGRDLYHASSKAGTVVKVNFADYARKTDGVILFAFTPLAKN